MNRLFTVSFCTIFIHWVFPVFVEVYEGPEYHSPWNYIWSYAQQMEATCSQFGCLFSRGRRKFPDEALATGQVKENTYKGSSKHRWVL